MNYWLISDTHLNHANIEQWGGRSGDWQEQIWKGLRAIPAGDTLIHLGDVCIGEDQAIHNKLYMEAFARNFKEPGEPTGNVKAILVRGNHDKKSIHWYEEHGWDFACDGLDLIYQGHYIHFTHRPQRERPNMSWNIHGHTHGNMHRSEEYIEFYDRSYHIDISPEIVGFKPVRLDLLLKNPPKHDYIRT